MGWNVDEQRLTAWKLFLQAHAAIFDVLEDELRAEHDLPLTWYDVLTVLSQAEDQQLRMQDLARSVLLSKSGLTRLFDRMVQAGLVERRPCPSDRRSTYACLTPAGVAALEAAAPTHGRGIEEHFAQHLTDEETRVMQVALSRILAAVPTTRTPSSCHEDGVASANGALATR